MKNLGEKSIDEIKTALAALGLSLGMRIDPNLLGALGRGGDEMRHGKAGFKLGRVTAHRWALFRNLLVALFRHERIMTTEAKAKAVRGLADHMVTLAKRDNLHARRQVLAMVPDTDGGEEALRHDRRALRRSSRRLHPDHQGGHRGPATARRW